jgi:hypothetical protein
MSLPFVTKVQACDLPAGMGAAGSGDKKDAAIEVANAAIEARVREAMRQVERKLGDSLNRSERAYVLERMAEYRSIPAGEVKEDTDNMRNALKDFRAQMKRAPLHPSMQLVQFLAVAATWALPVFMVLGLLGYLFFVYVLGVVVQEPSDATLFVNLFKACGFLAALILLKSVYV